MNDKTDQEYKIRGLLEVEKPDKNWFQTTEKLLGLQRFDLNNKSPIDTVWKQKWGAVQHIKQNGEKGLAWHRTDGANPIALLGKSTLSLKIARLALFANLIAALKDKGNLSFIKMGFPKNWQQYKVLIDGEAISQIIEADALLGICLIAKSDENGIVTNEKGDIDSIAVKGYVEIKRNEENLGSFF